MKLSVTLVLGFVALCQCNVLTVRQAESEQSNGPSRVIILRQLEEWLRLIQSSMTRLSYQFNRLINPSEGRLESDDLSEAKKTLRDIDGAINGLNGLLLSRNAGALQSNPKGDQDRFSDSRVPIIRELEDVVKLAQKQITEVSSTITKALTGGLNLDGTSAEELNKNVNGGPIKSGVPFFREYEEYLELIQRQINRLGGTVQRVIQGGSQVQHKNIV